MPNFAAEAMNGRASPFRVSLLEIVRCILLWTNLLFMRPQYDLPRVLQAARICVEKDFLNGSVTEMTVESTGQEVGGVFDYSAPESTFNHEWGE